MALLSLGSLLVAQTKESLYNLALSIAETVGLPVTSWEPGDPTRSLYHLLAEALENLDSNVAQFVAAGFLDHAAALPTTDWLVLLAKQVFNVDAQAATYATTTVTLTNGGGGLYDSIAAGDLTFRNTATGKTYHNTSGGTLASGPGTTLDVTVEADEPGSESSAGATEIDDLVTDLLGVTVSNATAAVGLDAESAASLVQRCRDKLGALSPNGPREGPSYVARTSSLTGTTEVTRARTYGDTTTGDFTSYLAGGSGAVSSDARDLVEAAIVTWATPLCTTPTVASSTNVTIAIAYELWIYESVGLTSTQIQDGIAAALGALFAVRPIGGDIIPPAASGSLYHSLIESEIRRTYADHVFRVSVTTPAADTALTIGQVAVLGTITPTINLIQVPA